MRDHSIPSEIILPHVRTGPSNHAGVWVRIASISILFLLLLGGNPRVFAMDAYVPVDRNPELLEISDGVERGSGPEALDADKKFYLFNKNKSYIDLKLDCHPDRPNYVTVKVWGGSGSGNGSYGDKLVLHTSEGQQMVTWQRKGNPLPGRFYYGTAPIPREATEGTSSVEIKLKYNKGKDTPGPNVYGVYTHI